MQVGMTIEDGGLGKALARLLERTANLKPAFLEIGSYLQMSTEQRIEKEGPGPGGEKWPPLAPSTLKKRGPGAKKLRDKGHLYGSLTYMADRLSVAMGTNKIQAAILQKGGKTGRGHAVTIPPRPYIGVSTDDEKNIGEILGHRLMGRLQ
jgi:phage virion morphogenesis protein